MLLSIVDLQLRIGIFLFTSLKLNINKFTHFICNSVISSHFGCTIHNCTCVILLLYKLAQQTFHITRTNCCFLYLQPLSVVSEEKKLLVDVCLHILHHSGDKVSIFARNSITESIYSIRKLYVNFELIHT